MNGLEELLADLESSEIAVEKEWRLERFLSLRDRAGRALDELQCALLAETGADWHALDRLLSCGCPIETAFRVLV